ncbi:cupin domain-containing protein [Flavobacterium maritimum]|uniref:cupin domain-containing protein n=1 Tax=Flavobacterium maritimum TaxID=3149042 RepID=UPI0032B5D716
MKTIKMISMLTLIGLFLLLSPSTYAQDPMKVGPKVYKKVLLNNEKVRVMSVEFAPGVVMPMHSHPHHTIYVLTGGKLQITEKGKAPSIADLKAGDVLYFPPVTHTGKNIGTTTVKLVVTEIKPEQKK